DDRLRLRGDAAGSRADVEHGHGAPEAGPDQRVVAIPGARAEARGLGDPVIVASGRVEPLRDPPPALRFISIISPERPMGREGSGATIHDEREQIGEARGEGRRQAGHYYQDPPRRQSGPRSPLLGADRADLTISVRTKQGSSRVLAAVASSQSDVPGGQM